MINIKELADGLRESGLNVFRITVINEGKTKTVRLKEDCDCRNIYSVSKAYTMTAIGMLYDDGILKPEEKIADIFKDEMPENADKKWYSVTIDNVLCHKMGITKGFLDIDAENASEYGTDNYLEKVLLHPIEGTVGETYAYSDAAYYLLSCVVTKKTGRNMCEYLLDRLFYPLAFGQVAWAVCPRGRSMGATGLYISCEDMTKLGQLWLDNGIYGGRRLISEEWIKMALERGYAFTPLLPEKDGYQKTGMKGQKLWFSRKEHTVLGIQSYDDSNAVGSVMMKYL